jgi:hypothetical protein
MKNDLAQEVSDLKVRLEKVEKASKINTRILRAQWDLRQSFALLETRVEKLEQDVEKKLDAILRKFEQLSCYKKEKF